MASKGGIRLSESRLGPICLHTRLFLGCLGLGLCQRAFPPVLPQQAHPCTPAATVGISQPLEATTNLISAHAPRRGPKEHPTAWQGPIQGCSFPVCSSAAFLGVSEHSDQLVAMPCWLLKIIGHPYPFPILLGTIYTFNLELQETMSITLVLQPNSRFFYLNSPLLHHVSKWHENTSPPH